jgi:hypothetical protein
MRVYAEVRPPWLGRVMYRINDQFRFHAPPGVEFTTDPIRADFQVLDVIGPGFVEELCCRRFVLQVQGFLPQWSADRDFWLEWLGRAGLVVSFSDLPGILQSSNFNFVRLPWGVDGNIFYPRADRQRVACIFTSGYDPALEAILECREAARRANQPMIHLGPVLPSLGEPGIVCVNGISDDELAGWYSEAWRVSGLRRGAGFELPCLEGLACGARPVVFDTPEYRYWYEGIAEFLPELPAAELIEGIYALMQTPSQPVTDAEREAVLDRFGWAALMARLWSAIAEAFPHV